MLPPTSETMVGRWWLPQTPNDDEAGSLHIDDTGGMELSINGVLEDVARWAQPSIPATPIIWGLTTRQKLVTLVGSLPRGITHSVPGYPTERYSPQIALIGDHLAAEDLKFTAVRVTFQGLAEWLGASGIRTSVGETARAFQINLDPPEIDAVELPDGTIGRPQFDYRWNFTGHVDESISILYEFLGELDIDDATAYVHELRNLLTVQRGISALPSRVSLYGRRRSATHIPKRPAEELLREPLDLVRDVVHPVSAASGDHYEYLLTAQDHPGHFEGTIRGWHETSRRFRRVIEVATSLYYGPQALRNPELILAASMAETFHRLSDHPQEVEREDLRRWSDLLTDVPSAHVEWLAAFVAELVEPSLRRRLTDLVRTVKPLGDELIQNIPQYALRLNRWRNSAVHRSESDELTGAHLYQLATVTRLIVELNLMRSAGYDLVGHLDRIRSTQRFRAASRLRQSWPPIT